MKSIQEEVVGANHVPFGWVFQQFLEQPMKPHVLVLLVAIPVLMVIAGLALVVGLTWQYWPQLQGREWFDAADAQIAILDPPDWQPQIQPTSNEEIAAFRGEVVGAAQYRISGPFTHANLDLFLIHGRETWHGPQLLTLQEAMDRGLAIVSETGTPQLILENRSDMPIYIQSGDIVKGGQQDRVLPYDMIVPPGQAASLVAVFCVEQGRSSVRGTESVGRFSAATDQLPGRDLRLAALYHRSQTQVWHGVRAVQANLSRSLGHSAVSSESPTSLQLTLESPDVQRHIHHYVNALQSALDGKQDVIGMVVAINGRIESADIYASGDLFRQLWPRALKAHAIAALAAEDGREISHPFVQPDAVRAFLQDDGPGCLSRIALTTHVHLIQDDRARAVLFDTCDRRNRNLVVHRIVLGK
jgi:hypothetical protein